MPDSQTSPANEALDDVFAALSNDLAAAVLGQPALIERLLIAVLADGHVLLEGPPGLAKTRAAFLLANGFQGSFQRVQFTPDLLPADLTGTTLYHPHEHRFEFNPGPLFHNFILADEINRAPAKVQAALLEAMEERQITVGGETRPLEGPFFVIATQNPIEDEGTYELPAAQLDRFVMRVVIDYPSDDAELAIIDLVRAEERRRRGPSSPRHAAASRQPAQISRHDLRAARAAVLDVTLSDPVKQYVVRLVSATRGRAAGLQEVVRHIAHPVSPRGTLALVRLAQARAWLRGRDHVLPEDVQELAVDVLAHRIGLSYRAEAEGIAVESVLEQLLDRVAVV